jgi:YfiH family protein
MQIDTSFQPTPINLGPFVVAFSTKSDGNMERVQAKRQQTHENREGFIKRIGLASNTKIYRIRPSHSPNIEFISKHEYGFVRDVVIGKYAVNTDFDFYDQAADGLLTQDRNTAVMLISGDCTPVILWDESSLLHGILHIGLLGALNNMAQTLLPIFKKRRIEAQNMHVYLGPSISPRNYDVTKSGLWLAIENQVRLNNSLKPLLDKHFNGTYFDVRGAVVDQLLSIGIQDSKIQMFSKCTTDPDSNFFSHYAAKQSGQTPEGFASIIWER